MIAPLVVALALVADPRPELVELQIDGRPFETLARTERVLAERPEEAQRLGLDYLRGHLLDLLGRPREAVAAFAATLTRTPRLAFYSRYRMALEQERMGHPEVAAGLVATAVVQADPASPLLPEALRLLARTLARGGDCRLLQGASPEALALAERRRLLLTQADCSLRAGDHEFARALLVGLIEQQRGDEVARAAAERLAAAAGRERGRLPRLVGLTWLDHREPDRALALLRRGSSGNAAGGALELEVRWAQARSQMAQGRFGPAAVVLGEVAEQARRAGDGRRRARALAQQGQAFELLGRSDLAAASWRQSFSAQPEGDLSGPVLLARLRLARYQGDEAAAGDLFRQLGMRWAWREPAARAALILAAADLARGRVDRAAQVAAWLDRGAAWGSREERVEVAYWRGRLAELTGDGRKAVAQYLDACRPDLYHPVAQAALARLRGPALGRTAAAEGRRLAARSDGDGLYDAWLLLGDGDPSGRLARRKRTRQLLEDRTAGPYLRLAEVPITEWPLWRASLDRPEEMLLALGLWQEGGPVVRTHFPPTAPSLAFTGALQLARAGQHARAIGLAEALRQRTPGRVPIAWQPRAYRSTLYPEAFRAEAEAQTRARRLDPRLLLAVVREASHFDPRVQTGPSMRGLFQLDLATARRLAGRPDLALADLERPDLALTLGAARLAELLAATDSSVPAALAAWHAGAPQARNWQAHCATPDPAEYYTQVTAPEVRTELRRTLATWAQYQHLGPGA
ncbi:MAG TPA: transglycosylase SLT domain-containing protein [Thermoanaerobaculia bacterium]|nr:transglycosylase SLT domain-containing protein [Thermoanaerobaculia bacterium]